MPELKWSQYDFIEFFGVLPKQDEYTSFTYYTVERNGLWLSFVLPFEDKLAEIYLNQGESENLLLSFRFYVLGNINYRKDKNTEVLEFQRCILASDRSLVTERNEVFDDLMFPNKVDLELIINPEISIRFF